MLMRFRSHAFLALLIVSVLLSGCFGFLKKPDPEITVQGIEDGGTYEEPVTPVITAKEDTEIKEVTLNGKPFESGTQITKSGSYTLRVVAEHKKGKAKTFEFKFKIVVGPSISVTGVFDGGIHKVPVKPVVTVTQEDAEVTIKLNEQDFASGSEITDPGDYTLVVTATDAANQTAEKTISFKAVELLHEFAIDADGTGFGSDKGSTTVNTDLQYIKSGERSLKFENEPDKKSAFRIHRKGNYHPDWINDWSTYERFSFWVYIVDKNKIDSFEFRLYTPSNPHDKGNTVSFDLSGLGNGWNRLDFAFADMMTDMDDLKNMANNDNIWIDIIIRSSVDTVTVYFDDFIMYTTALEN